MLICKYLQSTLLSASIGTLFPYVARAYLIESLSTGSSLFSDISRTGCWMLSIYYYYTSILHIPRPSIQFNVYRK